MSRKRYECHVFLLNGMARRMGPGPRSGRCNQHTAYPRSGSLPDQFSNNTIVPPSGPTDPGPSNPIASPGNSSVGLISYAQPSVSSDMVDIPPQLWGAWRGMSQHMLT